MNHPEPHPAPQPATSPASGQATDSAVTTLHILHTAPLPPSLTRLWSDGDTLLLTGAAVTLACRPDVTLPESCVVLADAVAARGLNAHLRSDIAIIDMDAWVALVVRHARSLSWT